MSAWESIPRGEIEHLCSYITDDGTIAAYFNLPRRIVVEVRATIPAPRRKHSGKEHYVGDNAGTGFNSHLIAADEARCGSQRLNEALQCLFRDWEEKHGFQRGAGQRLVPAGYNPQRDGVAA